MLVGRLRCKQNGRRLGAMYVKCPTAMDECILERELLLLDRLQIIIALSTLFASRIQHSLAHACFASFPLVLSKRGDAKSHRGCKRSIVPLDRSYDIVLRYLLFIFIGLRYW